MLISGQVCTWKATRKSAVTKKCSSTFHFSSHLFSMNSHNFAFPLRRDLRAPALRSRTQRMPNIRTQICHRKTRRGKELIWWRDSRTVSVEEAIWCLLLWPSGNRVRVDNRIGCPATTRRENSHIGRGKSGFSITHLRLRFVPLQIL